MLQFFSLAEMFLNGIISLGDYLLNTTVAEVFNPIMPLLPTDIVADALGLSLSFVGDVSLGFAIFGGSITFFVVWKLICFFTDIVS